MPHLAISEENNARILALHAVNRAGQLYDPVAVEYAIYDMSTGSPVQVYPPTGREDVTGLDSTKGVYPAWDVGMDIGLKPGVTWDADAGPHRIKWWFTDADDATITNEWTQDFYVSAAGLGLGHWSYISPNELRDEGLSVSDVPNAWMMELLRRAHELIDTACKQSFRPVTRQFKLNGMGGPRLHLNVPIIGITWLKANLNTTELDTSSWHAFANPVTMPDAGWLPEDYRRNPIIEMVANASIFAGGGMRGRPGVFDSGAANQEIHGVFGFLEPNGTTPILIREAAKRLVFYNAERLSAGSSTSVGGGTLKRLKVDRHEQEWDTASSSGLSRTSALASGAEVEEIIARYRAPIFIAGSS